MFDAEVRPSCDPAWKELRAEPRRESQLLAGYRAVRRRTEMLAAPLSAEDQTVQSMPDASPTKWHRAHTSWFFETFLLRPYLPGYRPFDTAYDFLFNSYYEAIGPRHARPSRGLLSRPGIDEIAAYRAYVDEAMERLIGEFSGIQALVRLGLYHEQQHQELLLTDIKHALAQSPLRPAYMPLADKRTASAPVRSQWIDIDMGVHLIGADADGVFHFDNEGPAHPIMLGAYSIADRPVSNWEFKAFIADGGYQRPELWLSDGWAEVQSQGWEAPGYWRRHGLDWTHFTLHGDREVLDDEPVCHVSYYEAAAFAEWAGCRLPTEFEWEAARSIQAAVDPRLEALHPGRLRAGFHQQVWEWTASAYLPYPDYRPAAGPLGEYNGKFMANQMILRGRSCATADGHSRPTYRNFFSPSARWQFSGLRLARRSPANTDTAINRGPNRPN